MHCCDKGDVPNPAAASTTAAATPVRIAWSAPAPAYPDDMSLKGNPFVLSMLKEGRQLDLMYIKACRERKRPRDAAGRSVTRKLRNCQGSEASMSSGYSGRGRRAASSRCTRRPAFPGRARTIRAAPEIELVRLDDAGGGMLQRPDDGRHVRDVHLQAGGVVVRAQPARFLDRAASRTSRRPSVAHQQHAQLIEAQSISSASGAGALEAPALPANSCSDSTASSQGW